jgi:hypothetical protein
MSFPDDLGSQGSTIIYAIFRNWHLSASRRQRVSQ